MGNPADAAPKGVFDGRAMWAPLPARARARARSRAGMDGMKRPAIGAERQATLRDWVVTHASISAAGMGRER